MIRYLVFGLLILFTHNLSAQHNTSICDDLKSLFLADQSKRGRASDVYEDHQRLKRITQLYNQNGIPYDSCTDNAIQAYWYICAHTHSHALRKLAFPIIYDLYSNNFLDSTQLIEYHISSIYDSEYSGFWQIAKDSSVAYFIDKLQLSPTGPVDLLSVDLAISEFQNIRDQKKIFLSKWKAKPITKTYELDGKNIERKYKGHVIRIYTINDKLYYDSVPPSGDVAGESMAVKEDPVNGGYIIVKRDDDSRFVIQEDALIHLVAKDTVGVYIGF